MCGCVVSLVVPAQELMPQLLTILRRGRDSAAVYSILEGCLLLGGVAVLQPHEAVLAAALQASLARLLQALSAPLQLPARTAGSPQPRSGDGPALCQTLWQLLPCKAVMSLLRKSCAANVGCSVNGYHGTQALRAMQSPRTSYRRRLRQPA